MDRVAQRPDFQTVDVHPSAIDPTKVESAIVERLESVGHDGVLVVCLVEDFGACFHVIM